MTNRWRIKVQDDLGRARVVLTDGQNVIGVVTMTWTDYMMLCRSLIHFVIATSKQSIEKTLGDRIWADAQRIFDNSPELAKAKLIEFGWNADMVTSYADQMSKQLADMLVGFLPEHTL